MKGIDEILKQDPVYLHSWNDKDDLITSFGKISAPKSYWDAFDTEEELMAKDRNVNILFASYSIDNYVGDAFVLLEKNGNLYEVNGSHSSWSGLEDQFDPEITTLEALEHRLVHGKMGAEGVHGHHYASELKEFLGVSNGN